MYNTYTIYTREEYTRFLRTITVSRLKRFVLLIYLLSFLFLFFTSGNISFLGVAVALIHSFLIFLVAVIFVLPFTFVILRRNWNTDKSIQNLCVDITFDENDLKISSINSKQSIRYEDVHRVIETKTNFYIMISAAKGYVIVKDNCSKELIAFIRNLKK